MVGLVVALVATACSGGEPTSVDRTDPPIPTEPTRPPIDITVVPEEITVEYVQAVVDELDQALGDAIRLAQSEGAVTEEVVARLEALYPTPQVEFEVGLLQEAFRTDFALYESPVGNKRSTVGSVIESGTTCVKARVARDVSQVFRSSERLFETFVYMVPGTSDRTAVGNPTPWLFVYDGPTPDGLPPPGTCSDYR